jgi:hypothetical protein
MRTAPSSFSGSQFCRAGWQNGRHADRTTRLEFGFLVALVVVVVAFEARLDTTHFFALPPLVLSVGHVHGHVARTYFSGTGSRQLAQAVLNLPAPEIFTPAEVENGQYEVGPINVVLDFENGHILFAILLAFAPRAVGEALKLI